MWPPSGVGLWCTWECLLIPAALSQVHRFIAQISEDGGGPSPGTSSPTAVASSPGAAGRAPDQLLRRAKRSSEYVFAGADVLDLPPEETLRQASAASETLRTLSRQSCQSGFDVVRTARHSRLRSASARLHAERQGAL